jgi:hypothetical protein
VNKIDNREYNILDNVGINGLGPIGFQKFSRRNFKGPFM